MAMNSSVTCCAVPPSLRLAFSFEEMLRYSGPDSPAGVALAFKAMELAFSVIAADRPPEGRRVDIDTAFRGPGARDGFELVTRCTTEGRYVVDARLERPERGVALEQFVFRLRSCERSVTLLLREGQVTDEFIAMARNPDRTPDDENRFMGLKQAMADGLMAQPADAVFELDPARA